MNDHNLQLPKVLKNSPILDGLISVRKERLLYANKHEEDYIVVTSKAESVSIIATSPNGDILVTKEYRHPVKRVLLGLPGGLVDDNEPILEAAKRELLEETGCVAESYVLLGSCYPLPGLLAQKMHIVHAQNARHLHPTAHEPTETLESQFLSPAQLQAYLKKGIDVDATLCSSLYFYNEFKRKS